MTCQRRQRHAGACVSCETGSPMTSYRLSAGHFNITTASFGMRAQNARMSRNVTPVAARLNHAGSSPHRRERFLLRLAPPPVVREQHGHQRLIRRELVLRAVAGLLVGLGLDEHRLASDYVSSKPVSADRPERMHVDRLRDRTQRLADLGVRRVGLPGAVTLHAGAKFRSMNAKSSPRARVRRQTPSPSGEPPLFVFPSIVTQFPFGKAVSMKPVCLWPFKMKMDPLVAMLDRMARGACSSSVNTPAVRWMGTGTPSASHARLTMAETKMAHTGAAME